MGTRNEPSHARMIVQTVEVGRRWYEQRYQLCHKKNCQVCYGEHHGIDMPPGHGPYWYMVTWKWPKRVRIYIGKELDTGRFIQQNGEIDWAAIAARRKARGARKAAVGETELG